MDENKSKIWSSVITLLLIAGLLAILICTNINIQYPPEGFSKWAQMNEDSIYVETEDIPLPLGGEELAETGDLASEMSDEPENGPSAADQGPDEPAETQKEGEDLNDAGRLSPVQPKTITSSKESSMKVKEKPRMESSKPKQPIGAAKNNPKPTSKPAVKAKTETKSAGKSQASSQSSAIGNKMKNAFGKGGNSRSSGSNASPSSGSNGSSLSGHASLGSGLVGYTGEYFGRPHSTVEGTVIVQVHVNARGYVTQAQVVGGSISNAAARQSCVAESKKSRFSVPKNRTTEGIGTIVWRFK